MRLPGDLPALGRDLVEEPEAVAPLTGRPASGLRDGDMDGAPGPERERAQVLADDGVADARGELEHADAQLAEHTDQRVDLVPVGDEARNRVACEGAVDRRARCREADRTVAQGRCQLLAHRGKLRDGGHVRVRALAHHVAAQRGMPDVTRIVHALRRRVHRVEIVAERPPSPRHTGGHVSARDVLGALDAADHEIRLLEPARREGEPAVPHDGRRDAVIRRVRRERIPEELGIEVRVALDEAGRDAQAIGIERLGGRLTDPTDRGDAAVDDPDVAGERGRPGPVDDAAPTDHQIEHVPPPPGRTLGRGTAQPDRPRTVYRRQGTCRSDPESMPMTTGGRRQPVDLVYHFLMTPDPEPLTPDPAHEPTSELLGEDTYRRLRWLIVTGQFADGERLPEAQLALRLQVSRTPLREALRRLAADGLIEIRAQRSAVVRPMDVDDALQLAIAFAAVARPTYILGLEKLTPDDRALLETHATRLGDAVRSAESTADGIYAILEDVHRVVYRASGNWELLRVIESLQPRFERMWHARPPDSRLQRARERGAQELDAIIHGEPALALALFDLGWQELRTSIERDATARGRG